MESKNKIVSLRLSRREYAEIEQTSRNHGYRSVSQFARCAVLSYASVTGSPEQYSDPIDELRQRLDNVDAQLSRIAACIRLEEVCDSLNTAARLAPAVRD